MKFGFIESEVLLVRVGFDPFRGISKKNHNYVSTATGYLASWVRKKTLQKNSQQRVTRVESLDFPNLTGGWLFWAPVEMSKMFAMFHT